MAVYKKCPVCQTSVKLENLKAHVGRVHPRFEGGLDLIHGATKQLRASSTSGGRFRVGEKGLYLVGAVIVAVVVFCCLCSLCLAVVGYLYGDQIFGLTVRLGAGAI